MLFCAVLIKCFFTLVIAKRSSSYGSGVGYPHQTHTKYSSTGVGQSTRHSYPQSTGLSGNRGSGYNSYHRSEVHHHYHYNPPQQINYGSTSHPVYHGIPPVYVYEYRDSGSRFDTLLTGLALYNLGRMSQSHNNHDYYNRDYRSSPGETCKLGISKNNGEYEETRIDCKLISSFIWEAKGDTHNSASKTVTTVHSSNFTKIVSANETKEIIVSQDTTTTNAVDVKGPSIKVVDGMSCFMIRISRDSVLKRKVDCGLLQTYATRSLYSHAIKLKISYFVEFGCLLALYYLRFVFF
ncbi:uncharacterized protein LOC119840282 [Zerene cesonia]|uniref:uncharacterized protein LOC119840282 n=1 Tax=Zerene cesonia TaxID=33412 RepID=UPI0018E4FBD0|nr:uncharacterized protein LOC119840282 [Zerene cesonia]